MQRSLVTIFTAVCIFCIGVPTALGWSAGGHHIIASLAFQMLEDTDKQLIIEILRQHPQFDTEFVPPTEADSPAELRLWIAGRAGYWPDVARNYPEFNRSTWHYQLGSTMVLGNVSFIDVPATPVELPADADLNTQELYIGQGIELCRRVLGSGDASASDRALAICWLAHLVGDSHQPCHAGSLYAEIVFPEGDRGANSIRTQQARNMHALWDQLLGQRYAHGDVRRRMVEIQTDAELAAMADEAMEQPNYLEPSQWLKESRDSGLHSVYTPEVVNVVLQAQRAGAASLEPIALSEEYLKNAGRVAQGRALLAARRLAAVWGEALAAATDESSTQR
ncbi:MAG TPA: hypothetical protein DDZ51_17645 [Planctomycetaceae bacterium]|nr:hypothetical protein [Planctomycetaceae bacterium]